MRQPVAEAGDGEIDAGVGLRAALSAQRYVTVARRQIQRAVDAERWREGNLAVAAERTLAQGAAQLVEPNGAARSVFVHFSTRGQRKRQRAGPLRRERAGIEAIGFGLEFPVDLRLQHDFATGPEAALRLLQIELAQRDLLRRSVELDRDLRQLAGRSQREIALRSELLGRAARIDGSVRRQRLANEVGRQFDALPGQLHVAAERLGIELQFAFRGQRPNRFRRAQVQVLDRQALAGKGKLQRIEQYSMAIRIDIAAERPAVAVAAAVQIQRERLE